MYEVGRSVEVCSKLLFVETKKKIFGLIEISASVPSFYEYERACQLKKMTYKNI